MEKTSCSTQALVLLSLLIVGLCSKTNVAVAYPWTRVPATFAFGDSELVDAETNELMIEVSTRLADCRPCGATFFHRAIRRFSSGCLALDSQAFRLGLPFVPPFLQPRVAFGKDANFASGGSGFLSTTGHGGGVIPLTTQVSQSQQVAIKLASDLGAAAAGNLISNTMHSFATGSNDLSGYFRSSTLHQIVSSTKFVPSVLSERRAHVQTMYSAGFRRVVSLCGIGLLGCSPQHMAAANGTNGIWVDAATQLAQAYSLALPHLLCAKLPNVHAVMVNRFDILV